MTFSFVSSAPRSAKIAVDRGNFFDRHFAPLMIISEEEEEINKDNIYYYIMGVHGLWRLIESTGKPVPLESLENKVLAVDVSIWLHHFVKGFQDSKGAPVPNAHLLGIYHRLCKLLYFRIKPIFVFDGGVPALKRKTMIKRLQKKNQTLSEADIIHKNLLSVLIKHTALSQVLSEKTKAAIKSSTSPTKRSNEEELYKLPTEVLDSTVSSDEEDFTNVPSRQYDLHSIDTQSSEFKCLPVDVRHEILTDLKETRKQSSWGRLHELPAESDDFSVFQMKRLLKRQSVQSALEEAEQEMGGHSLSLGELEQILKDQGVINNIQGNRIASDENTRYLLIKNLKQAVEDAKNTKNILPTIDEDAELPKPSTSKEENLEELPKTGGNQDDLQKTIALDAKNIAIDEGAESPKPSTSKEKNLETITVADQEFEDDLQQAIALSLEQTHEQNEAKHNEIERQDFSSFLKDVDDSEDSEGEDPALARLTPAQRYMMEYSRLTPNEIAKIIAKNSKTGNNKNLSVEDRQIKAIINEKQISSGSVEPILNNKASKVETIEIMSDSDSSDFVDVEEQKDHLSPVASMEVVFNANESIEDDLFKDVFEASDNDNISNSAVNLKKAAIIDDDINKQKNPDTAVTGQVSQKIETVSANLVNSETIQSTTKSIDKEKKDKSPEKIEPSVVEKLIENYAKPKDRTKDLPGTSSLSVEQIQEMRKNVEKEKSVLEKERSGKERMARNINDQMYQEAQELLELFGVPFITAPMEAEAQCAFLNLLDFTDGTITDDSDIWLFGGKTVYKNFFEQNKTVLEYRSESILHHFKLSREHMILLAMLVGSDYTVGLTGVGPVTALEILAAFPPKTELISGLFEFKRWFAKGEGSESGRNSLRSKLKNLSFSENFPNTRIAQAYLDPQVDKSSEKFSWAKPDVVGLIDFAERKFGWTQCKTEKILNPVLKRLEETKQQKTITDFYKTQFKRIAAQAEKPMSKRVKTALERLERGVAEEEEVISEPNKKREKKNKNVTKAQTQSRKKKTSNSEDKVNSKRRKNSDAEIEILKKTETALDRLGKGVAEENPKPKKNENVTKAQSQSRKKKTSNAEDKVNRRNSDAEIEILRKIETVSKKRVEEIESEVYRDLQQQENRKVNLEVLHKREVIPQKQRDKTDMLRNKLKAIETYRKSKKGPGYVKPRAKNINQPQENASYLSSDSSSD